MGGRQERSLRCDERQNARRVHRARQGGACPVEVTRDAAHNRARGLGKEQRATGIDPGGGGYGTQDRGNSGEILGKQKASYDRMSEEDPRTDFSEEYVRLEAEEREAQLR